MTTLLILKGYWVLYLVNLPVLIYNIRLLQSQYLKFHFITYQEYKAGGRKDHNKRATKLKSGFYLILTTCIIFKLGFAASNLMMYHALGRTLGQQ